jgi:hypothetical protein
MTLGSKHKFGGKVTDCSINLGYFVTKSNLYITILGSYDILIGMYWLESHDAILNCKMKWLIFMDDLGYSRVIVGRNQRGFLEVYFFPTIAEDHVQRMKDV